MLNILGDFIPLWGKFFGAGDRLFPFLSRVSQICEINTNAVTVDVTSYLSS
ncbi:hypothetical protein [Anabaena sp. CCY 9910]|uniref:hypothetical protein n=1 Tax=Anabaena sp. CCY 9910 TaxID=3103870 RepID=UPI0039E006D5